MKRVGDLWPRMVTFEALHRAAERAAKGKRKAISTCTFWVNLEPELLQLQADLEGGTYQPGAYRSFVLRDPKLRVISAAPFRDRVVHHALCEVLEPTFERVAIFDSYACREGKGQHKAMERAQSFARRGGYFLKLDIERYFESIHHEHLMAHVERLISDKKIVEVLGRIVAAGAPGSAQGRGLPIGNLTSQHLANLHLSPLDHLIKRQTGASFYLRYMDDMALWAPDKATLWEAHAQIEAWLGARGLHLKARATRLAPVEQGMPWLGCRVWPRLVRLDGPRKRRFIRTWKRFEAQHQQGALNEEGLQARLTSVRASVNMANAAALCRSLLERRHVSREAL